MMVLDQLTAPAAFLPLVAALVLLGLVLVRRRGTKYTNLPAGPPSHWFSGTALPVSHPWRWLYDQSRQYGPLMTIWRGSSPTIVVSTVDACDFVLEKNARDTADRPRQIMGDEIMSHNKRILLVSHGDRWRRLRKALHAPLQPQSARELRPLQEGIARSAALDILRDPSRFQDHIQSYAATLVVHMAYGRRGRAYYSDPEIREVVEGSKRLGITLRPGAFAIESYPWLRYFPGYLKSTGVQKWADDELDLFVGALRDVKARLASKQPVADCFAKYLLEHQREFNLEDDEIAYLCGSVFGAGSDTSSSAITICVMAAAVFPDQAARVRAELDKVAGGRMPSFDELDIESAPILRAFIAESFRWRPVSSGGFQHKTTADIVYRGQLVPAGAAIIPNHWAIHRDEAYYGPDVEAFNLDRWLDADGAFKTSMKHVQFGMGRRVCPGQHVAHNSVLINTAFMLWAFDIGHAVGNDGRPVPIDTLAFTNTANSHPLPFKAQFVPRHPNLEQLILDSGGEDIEE